MSHFNNNDSLRFIKHKILISDNVFRKKAEKYSKENSDNPKTPDKLVNLCVQNLTNKQKDWIYENRKSYPCLYEKMLEPVHRTKRFIHYVIQCRELFYWIHVWSPLIQHQIQHLAV